MIDYHICSLDGDECNTEDCNCCQKAQFESAKKKGMMIKSEETMSDFLHRMQEEMNDYCFKNHPEKMNIKCVDCEFYQEC